MKIYFGFGWISSGKNWKKSFKLPGAFSLFEDYSKRFSFYAPFEAGPLPGAANRNASKIWLCDTSPSAKQLSSEDLSKKLSQLLDSGTKELDVLIGGPDGFSSETIAGLKPDLRWNFGPLTLPHELAAVVAAEQLYRAWTILHRLPYHKGH